MDEFGGNLEQTETVNSSSMKPLCQAFNISYFTITEEIISKKLKPKPVNSIDLSSLYNHPISLTEVESTIHAYSKKSAPGPDEAPKAYFPSQ